MAIRIVRLGSERKRGEGIRFGTVRRPPRGVPKARHSKENWYDTWLPMLSPSAELMKSARGGTAWNTFTRRFHAEMKRPDAAHLLNALAALSHQTNFSVGCYCEDEEHCHRGILRELLEERGAAIVG
ncbi:MAG TPA: DUF488 family protein [Thermoanaerobaculia bacterium]